MPDDGERADDRAGVEYWDALWRGQALPVPVDPADTSLGSTSKQALHEVFVRELRGLPEGASILEVGCARSVWLPYFARYHGLHVAGLDYSQEGCAQARAILAAAGVDGEITFGDMFDPPPDLLGRFDAVVSFGVVEHFSDTAGAQSALATFLVPGGVLITVIPNMGRSIVGRLQKLLDRRVYDVHIPLDRRQLGRATVDGGLRLVRCDYVMTWNWSVINISDWRSDAWRGRAARVQSGLSKVMWALERRGVRFRPNRLTSPYIVAVGRTPDGPPPPGHA